MSPDRSPRIPRYSHTENWKPDEDDVAASQQPSSDDVILRALSVVPFVLVAAFGVVALVGWVIVVVFGVAAPGNAAGRPIWRWAQGQTLGHVLAELALAVGIGLIPLAVVLFAGWATAHGFRVRPHPLFWPAAELFWGIVAVALVVLDRFRSSIITDLQLGTLDRWFLFGVVVAAGLLAGIRVRRLRRRAR
jgi:hypothetical protein